MPIEASSAIQPAASAPADSDPLGIGTPLSRLLERAFGHLAAVMPGLPQLGVAMVLLVIAIAVSDARQATSQDDAVGVSTPPPAPSFDVAPF